MDKDRFQNLVDAYGGLEHWPPSERAAAERYAAEAPDAAAALQAALRLDAALDAWTLPGPGSALRDSVLAAAPQATTHRPAWRSSSIWWSSAGLAAACAAGVLIGAGANASGLIAALTPDRDATLTQALDRAGLSGPPSDSEQG